MDIILKIKIELWTYCFRYRLVVYQFADELKIILYFIKYHNFMYFN
jgi:hypothetical protein